MSSGDLGADAQPEDSCNQYFIMVHAEVAASDDSESIW